MLSLVKRIRECLAIFNLVDASLKDLESLKDFNRHWLVFQDRHYTIFYSVMIRYILKVKNRSDT